MVLRCPAQQTKSRLDEQAKIRGPRESQGNRANGETEVRAWNGSLQVVVGALMVSSENQAAQINYNGQIDSRSSRMNGTRLGLTSLANSFGWALFLPIVAFSYVYFQLRAKLVSELYPRELTTKPKVIHFVGSCFKQ